MKRDVAFLFSANGDVQDNTELFPSRKSKQPNTVFLNRKDKPSTQSPCRPLAGTEEPPLEPSMATVESTS